MLQNGKKIEWLTDGARNADTTTFFNYEQSGMTKELKRNPAKLLVFCCLALFYDKGCIAVFCIKACVVKTQSNEMHSVEVLVWNLNEMCIVIQIAPGEGVATDSRE